jgi:hypothetical protein
MERTNGDGRTNDDDFPLQAADRSRRLLRHVLLGLVQALLLPLRLIEPRRQLPRESPDKSVAKIISSG